MFDVGGGELLIIILAIIILFGPEKFPQIARLLNKGIQKARQAQSQIQKEISAITDEVQKNIETTGNSLELEKLNKKSNGN